jgi:alkyl hydroperoxide reductase subunit AhpC
MPALNSVLEEFAGFDAQVVGISIDSIFSHIAWQEKGIGILGYPLASDFYPHGGVAKTYGVLREGPPLPGISERSIFIVDKQGKIAFSKVYDLGDEPPHEDYFEALRALK